MIETFDTFRELVKEYSEPSDYNKNYKKLRGLRITSMGTFISLLKLGADIERSIRVSDELFKLSRKTTLTEGELIILSTRFRFINALIDGD